MSSKTKTILLIIVFVALMIGTSALYTALSENMDAGGLVADKPVTETTDADSSEDAANNNEGEAGTQEEDSSTDEKASQEAKKAPDFMVYDAQGNEVSLSSFFGKPIVLNFWASWCGPCKSEMPDFDEAYAKYDGEIQFLMVNMTDGSRETIDTASSFIEEQGYSFPVFFDSKYNASVTYSVSSLPTTYFIDAEGYLTAHAMGAIDASILQQGIDMIYSQ